MQWLRRNTPTSPELANVQCHVQLQLLPIDATEVQAAAAANAGAAQWLVLPMTSCWEGQLQQLPAACVPMLLTPSTGAGPRCLLLDDIALWAALGNGLGTQEVHSQRGPHPLQEQLGQALLDELLALQQHSSRAQVMAGPLLSWLHAVWEAAGLQGSSAAVKVDYMTPFSCLPACSSVKEAVTAAAAGLQTLMKSPAMQRAVLNPLPQLPLPNPAAGAIVRIPALHQGSYTDTGGGGLRGATPPCEADDDMLNNVSVLDWSFVSQGESNPNSPTKRVRQEQVSKASKRRRQGRRSQKNTPPRQVTSTSATWADALSQMQLETSALDAVMQRTVDEVVLDLLQ
jgi:2-keto-3-deoxy-6-phosphogluconate aldolase